MTLVAITIRPPWSIAIRQGAKLVENRGRRVAEKHIGQQVAIHCGATWDKAGAADPRILDWWWGADSRRAPLDAAEFGPYMRGIIAVATLADCHQTMTPVNPERSCCEPWGDRTYNDALAWHLTFADVIGLPNPVRARGSLALPWTVPAGIEAQVRDQMKLAAEWS